MMQPLLRAASRAACVALLSFLLSSLALSGPAPAGESTTQGADSWLHPTEIVGSAIGAIGSAVGSVWSGVARVIWGGEPYEYLPDQIGDDDRRFFATLEALGLRLSTIAVGGGTFSRSRYRFVATREPSEADIRRAEQKLEEYRENASGLRAGDKERIARAILDVAGDRGFVLTAVVIELWPWPSATYEISDRTQAPGAGEQHTAAQSPWAIK